MSGSTPLPPLGQARPLLLLGSFRGPGLTPRPQPVSQPPGCAFVERHAASEHHAVEFMRGPSGNQPLRGIRGDERGVAFKRIAPPASTTGAHDRQGVERDRDIGARNPLERLFARQLEQIAARLAGRAARDPPGRALAAPGSLEIPFALNQVAHFHVEAESAPIPPGATGILPQRPAFDQHRTLELDPLDRAVAHVALAYRDGRGLAVLERPAAPPAAFDTLHDKAALGLR